MKSIKEINEELKELDQEYSKSENVKQFKESKKKRDAKRKLFLKNCITFLEGEPREDFLIHELTKTNYHIKQIEGSFGKWMQATPGSDALKNAKLAYYTEMGMPAFKLQRETLNYLLKQ